ncbi:hypothetical protein CEXT_352781 [Caerostris extrusa]|uniref:Uncharacterized protein n=1 Tax=Caerostris extrusa TaxID=172846 RepID=A0AAV4SVH0_CAEEX|nr:hypothetical protein CEXT_352781 [Caerostris extrusa]
MKCFAHSEQTYQDLIQFMIKNKFNFFDATPKSMPPVKAILKGLPNCTSMIEIEDALKDQFPWIKIVKFKSRSKTMYDNVSCMTDFTSKN